jgi:hypothetical protein
MNAAPPERKPATEGISGLIERIRFHGDESGFSVLRGKSPGFISLAYL